jgi:hypothetical protein
MIIASIAPRTQNRLASEAGRRHATATIMTTERSRPTPPQTRADSETRWIASPCDSSRGRTATLRSPTGMSCQSLAPGGSRSRYANPASSGA